NRSSACLRPDATSDVIQVQASSAALGLYSAGQLRDCDIPPLSFRFDQFQVPRNLDHKLGGEFVGAAAMPLAPDPGRSSSHGSAALGGFKLGSGLGFIRNTSVIADNVTDARLRAPLYFDRADVDLDVKALCCWKTAGNLLRPGTPFAVDAPLLRI